MSDTSTLRGLERRARSRSQRDDGAAVVDGVAVLSAMPSRTYVRAPAPARRRRVVAGQHARAARPHARRWSAPGVAAASARSRRCRRRRRAAAAAPARTRRARRRARSIAATPERFASHMTCLHHHIVDQRANRNRQRVGHPDRARRVERQTRMRPDARQAPESQRAPRHSTGSAANVHARPAAEPRARPPAMAP